MRAKKSGTFIFNKGLFFLFCRCSGKGNFTGCNQFRMKKAFLLSFFFLFIFQVQAQKDFRPGYIVTLQGDTLKGWVNFRKPGLNSRECMFRSSLPEKDQKFKASEIKGYGLTEGRHYRSYVLKETSATLNRRKASPKSYFLNMLVAGKADLFYVRDISGKNRFFIQKDTVFTELEVKEYTQVNPATGKQVKVRSKHYIGTLTNLFQDCKTLQPAINETGFKTTALSGLVKNYNTCLHPDSLYFAQKPIKSKTTIGVIAGTNYTFIKFYAPYLRTAVAADYTNQPGFSAGVTMNNTLPMVNNKLSLQTELLLVQNKFQSLYTYRHTVENKFIDYHVNADATLYSLKLPFQLRYSFNFRKLKPYVNGGIILSHDLTVKENGFIESEFQGQKKTSLLLGYARHKLYGGLVFGTGILYALKNDKAVFLDLKYLPENLPNLYHLDSKVNTIFLSTGFRF